MSHVIEAAPARMVRAVSPPDDVRRVQLAWLARLRWGALACQLLLAVAARLLGDIEVSSPAIAALLAVGVVTNALVQAAASRGRAVPDALIGAVFVLDVATLTALLSLTGGPLNPFSFLYLVHVAQATVALGSGWAWSIALGSVAAYGALFLGGSGPDHDHHGGMELHLRGMWIAFTVTALFIVYFVGSLRRSLADRDRALAEAQRSEARSVRLAGLATLAGGTAHELATPLGTIAVAAGELEQKLRALDVPTALADDARLVLDQVERCRGILSQMAVDAGEALGERQVAVAIGAVVEDALAEVKQRARITVQAPAAAAAVAVQAPRRAMAQALRGLVKNALEAAETPVLIDIERAAAGVVVRIRDEGPGLAPEVLARVGEPFFTTKPAGQGMGLGVFLARSLAERFGGAVDVTSAPGRGTQVELRLPERTSVSP